VSIRKISFAALLAAAAMAVSSASVAQFDGLYIGGGFGMFKATETANDPATDSSLTLGGTEHQGGWNVNAGYGGSVGILHLAIEVSYANQVGEISDRILGQTFTDGVEEAVAGSILPGFKFGPNGLAYLRIGAAQAKLKAARGGFSQTHNGKLYGIGMKQALAPNLALFIEYQNYDFKEKDQIQPASTGFILGAQYSFR